jgi:tetratricopeptide (TPR) repeat protein
MQQAAAEADVTVMVLSEAYLNAVYTQSEWAAAFAQDPEAKDRRLLPIRVAPCEPQGVLKALVYVDLMGIGDEAQAEHWLLDALKERAKPSTRPAFPQEARRRRRRLVPAKAVFPRIPLPIPYARNPFFTGREEVLEQVWVTLDRGGRAAARGLAGVGKTQMAIEYAYRYRNDYSHIFWVRAEQLEELITDYGDMAQALQLQGWDQPDRQAVAQLAKRWLETNDCWLLILDNADDLQRVRPFLPVANGHILLTTRAQALGDVAQPISVDKMPPYESRRLLFSRARIDQSTASSEEMAAAVALVAELDGLPLALDQAGAYVEEQCLTLEEYHALFESEKAALLRERGQLASDHPSVTVTFTLAFEKVAQQNAAAADLLRVCAFLAPDAIPEEIFTTGQLGDALSEVAKSPLQLRQTIADATRLSLISRDAQNKTLTLHRLVQVVLREMMAELQRQQWVEQAVAAVNVVFPDPEEYENWPQCRRLATHAHALVPWLKRYLLVSEAAVRLLNQTGYYYNAQGRYGEVEPMYTEALAMQKQLLGEVHPDVALILNNLAVLYDDQGRAGEAETLYIEALVMRKQLLGEVHPDVAISLNNLAVLYDNQGRVEEAETLYIEALAMQRQLFGEVHPDVALSLNNLAYLYYSQGRYGEAEPFYIEALAMRKQLLGEVHPNVATSLNNLAKLYDNQGRYGESEPLYRQAVALLEQTLGPEHPNTKKGRYNLEQLLEKMAGG